MILYFAIGLAAAWLIASIWMVVFARTLIYPFHPNLSASVPANLPGIRAVTLTSDDDTPLTVWLAPPRDGQPVILYFTGNAGGLAENGPLFEQFVGRGFGIAALNYRGAGGTPGKPSQPKLTADALALYDALNRLLGQPVPSARRVIYGRSLGAGLAVQLAARRASAGLVLESPFNRLCEVAQLHFPIFPACHLLPYERWASADLIGQISAPTLVLHGDIDRTIPLSQGRALFAAATEPKRLIVYPGAGHNDLRLHGAGIDAIDFIEGLTGG